MRISERVGPGRSPVRAAASSGPRKRSSVSWWKVAAVLLVAGGVTHPASAEVTLLRSFPLPFGPDGIAASASASLGLVFSGDSDGSVIAKTIDGSYLE